MAEKCQRCGEDGEDRRTLWMACFYAMGELGLPFTEQHVGSKEDGRDFFLLRVCKDCRSDWMQAIKDWFSTPLVDEPTNTGVYVRTLGRTREASPSEVEEMRRRPHDPR